MHIQVCQLEIENNFKYRCGTWDLNVNRRAVKSTRCWEYLEDMKALGVRSSGKCPCGLQEPHERPGIFRG